MGKATFTLVIFFLIFLFTYSASAKVVGWWRFEEGQGKEVEDSSGNQLKAVVAEGNLKWEKADLPSLVSDSTAAVEFDGKTSLEVKTDPLLDVLKITAEAWVKQKKISVYQPIIFRATYVINGSSQPGDFGGNGEIAYGYISIGGQNIFAIGPKAGLPQNQWIHVAITYDGNILLFWLNGKEVGKSEERKGKIDPGGVLYIGGRTGAAPDRHFIGLIDEVRISDEALKPDQFLLNVNPQGKLTTTWSKIKTQ
ncbi:LamG domain-containing protein [Candidatus Poribacteria bacterium]|nr:LamG domain-containing protein [Candidatus Poribacteria bacterium]